MSTILEEAKLRLRQDFISPSSEWEYLESLISKSETDRFPLLKWVFEKSPAYWESRARAGLVLSQNNEADVWEILKNLVESHDPDDNGTALTFFEKTGDPRRLELAKIWLSSSAHPVTQLEAIDFLKDVYPDEVQVCLRALFNNPSPDIQQSARKIAGEMGVNL